MKFGAQIRNKSVPEWRSYNFDYNDVKHKIKLATTDGSSPNKEQAIKNLEETIVEQIDIINLFINSKIGEIKRRIVYIESLLEKIDQNTDQNTFQLEGLISNLSSDLQKLSRFLVIQKTALRKSLKKYTKYSQDNGSLNYKINKYVINNQDSFIHTDLTGLYLELALVYDLIRENSVESTTSAASPRAHKRRSSISDPLHGLNQNESFDFESGHKSTQTFNFLVHYDNLNELKLFLLQNFYLIDQSMAHRKQILKLKSKSSTISIHDLIKEQSLDKSKEPALVERLHPQEQEAHDESSQIYRSNSIYLNNKDDLTDGSNLTMLMFDDPQNFYSIKSDADPGVLVTDSSFKQSVRSLLISAIGGLRKSSNVLITNDSFLNNLLSSCLSNESFEKFYEHNRELLDSLDTLEKLSIEWIFTKHLKPLVKVSLNKSRFTNTMNDVRNFIGSEFKCWVSLYSNIKLNDEDLKSPVWGRENEKKYDRLPFAFLQVSHNSTNFDEKKFPDSLQKLLDSHLVYRIEDTSLNFLTYSLFKQGKLSFVPTWSKIFQEDFDIRKLPPKRPAARKNRSKATLYENPDNDTSGASIRQQLTSGESTTQQRYWNEFDNGSDFEDGQGGFFIQLDEDDSSSFDLFSKFSIDNIYRASFKLSKTLNHYFPFLLNSLDTKDKTEHHHRHQQQQQLRQYPDQLISDPYNYGSVDRQQSDNESILSSSSSSLYDLKHSKLAHDNFLIFLALSTSLLSFFLTSVSIGITSSLLSYSDVSISVFVISVLLGSMLISLFFSVMSLCLYMMSDSQNRSTFQTIFIWTNFGLVNVMIIGGIVGVFGI